MDDQAINLSHYGALLAAVAHIMITKGISAIAARGGHYDTLLTQHMMSNGLDGVEAARMLDIPLSEAINMQ